MQRIINVVSYPSSGKGFLVFALSEILSMNVKGGSTNGFIFWDAIWFCCWRYCLDHMSKIVVRLSLFTRRWIATLTASQCTGKGVVGDPFNLKKNRQPYCVAVSGRDTDSIWELWVTNDLVEIRSAKHGFLRPKNELYRKIIQLIDIRRQDRVLFLDDHIY